MSDFPADAVSRRAVLAAGAGLPLLLAGASPGLATQVPQAAPAVPLERLGIRPRADWGADLRPRGWLEAERPGDVRFLLVHHTAQPGNDYGPGDVRRLLRGIYRYHTSGTKGWPDIAYNFFVDRYGGIWEGRTGSLQAPIKASATGGSQGFALLACYLGDHDAARAPRAARASMIRLLAALADRYGIDTDPGASTSFVSRGSSRWPRGSRVTTSTIAGHRDMSVTTCPGRYVYGDLRQRYQADVTAARRRSTQAPAGDVAAPPTSTPSASPSPDRSLSTPPSSAAYPEASSGAAAATAGTAAASAAATAAPSPAGRTASGSGLPSQVASAPLPGGDGGFDSTRAAVTGLVAVSAGAAATAAVVAKRGRG